MAQQGRFGEDLDVSGYIAQLPEGAAPLRSAVLRVEGVDPTRPYRAGAGPLVCSTSTSLAPSPAFSWDVNGYYRAFGFRWPYLQVTRKALRLAAHRQRAHASAWRIWALKALLDTTGLRRVYDRMELGTRYLDPFEQDAIKAEAARRASVVNTELADLDHMVTGEEMLSEMGFKLLPEEDEDSSGAGVSEVSGTPWEWSFYVWTAPHIDLDALALWQAELIAEHQDWSLEYGRVLEGFAVGIAGGQEWDWKVEVIDGEVVFFINADSARYHAEDAMEWALSSSRLMAQAPRLHHTDE